MLCSRVEVPHTLRLNQRLPGKGARQPSGRPGGCAIGPLQACQYSTLQHSQRLGSLSVAPCLWGSPEGQDHTRPPISNPAPIALLRHVPEAPRSCLSRNAGDFVFPRLRTNCVFIMTMAADSSTHLCMSSSMTNFVSFDQPISEPWTARGGGATGSHGTRR